jgi:hypothetical protein
VQRARAGISLRQEPRKPRQSPVENGMSQMPQRSMQNVFSLPISEWCIQAACVQKALMAGSSTRRIAMEIRRGESRVPSAMGPANVLARIRVKAAQKDAACKA